MCQAVRDSTLRRICGKYFRELETDFNDLAVVDPQRLGTYLLGMECDGATYRSSKAARDRDRLRQQVLERLGWRLYRIWSTDWFTNPTAETEKLIRHIRKLEAESRLE